MRSARHSRHIVMLGCICNLVLLRPDSTYLNSLPKDMCSANDAFTVIFGTVVLKRELLSPRTVLHSSPSLDGIILGSSPHPIIPKSIAKGLQSPLLTTALCYAPQEST